MNESTDVTLEQIEACFGLFKAVTEAKRNAIARRDEMCVDADVWGQLLDAYVDVAGQWDW